MPVRSCSVEGAAPRVRCLISGLACAALLAAAGPTLAQDVADGVDERTAPAADAAPGDFDQRFLAARELAWSGQREQALAAYSALLELSPGNSDVLLGRGRLYAWMDMWAEAEADLLAATASAPDYADAWAALGDLYLWTDRPARAVGAYGRWLALAPADDPAPLIARGRALRAAGDIEGSSADFRAAGGRGADAAQVNEYLASLTPRALTPGGLKPEAVVPTGYLWSAGLASDWTGFGPSRASWHDYSVSVRRQFEHLSLGFEALGLRRFGVNDQAFAVDGYVDVWSRAYAYLRYQHGPREDLFPGNGLWTELFQGVGQGWELSAAYVYMNFARTNVSLFSAGVGKYVGNWYVRLKHLYVPGDRYPSNSDRLLVRYYYEGDGDNYVEFVGSFGRSDQPLPNASGPSNTWYTGAAIVNFPSPRWGFKLGAGYGREDGGYDARSAFVSLYTRW